jgi:acetoin utilization deacetylase AcuC-like enzyme
MQSSYFNKFTNKSAKIAASGVQYCIDKMFNEQCWNYAFALIRPPGHHSGIKNCIHGFCVFNNVALAANYAKVIIK